LASQQLPSTREQLSRHQEGQFEWLLSIPVKTAAAGRRPRGDSHGDAELRQGGEKTLYFGCNLVNRGPLSDGAPESGKSTDVYTLLATRVKAEEEFIIERAPVFDEMEMAAAAEKLRLGGAPMAVRHYEGLDMPKSPRLVVEVNEIADSAGDRSRPLSRIEDSVEALDKLEEEIEALTQVAQLERVLSPEAATRNFNTASAKSTPLKRAATVRAPNSARSKTLERSSSVRQSTSAGDDDKAAATPSTRKVPRPTSLLPPKPLARSSKTPTVSTFELPGEAVARRLKEQREQRRSQQASSSDQAAAAAAAYCSPSKPHFKSTKIPTRPTFELPGEAISRAKREAREAKLRAQEEEERKRREFKARPIRAGVVGAVPPSSVPRDTLASLARQKSRSGGGSADAGSPTVITTPVAKKRQSTVFSSSTLPTRGRNPTSATETPTTTMDAKAATAAAAARATSVSTVASVYSSRSGNSHNSNTTNSGNSKLSAEEQAAQQQQRLLRRGREVFARESSFTAEREREKKERENAAREAREKAAERGRELSRVWAERQRAKVRGV
jgi:hypothetical protein